MGCVSCLRGLFFYSLNPIVYLHYILLYYLYLITQEPVMHKLDPSLMEWVLGPDPVECKTMFHTHWQSRFSHTDETRVAWSPLEAFLTL